MPGIGDIGGLLGFCSLGTSGLTGDLNNICQPSLPDPEPATAGIDSLVRPPAQAGPLPKTLYNQYGVAGQYWAATNLQCSDMTSLIGNNVAGMVFDVAKSIDRVTITVYQSAAGEGILGWLKNFVDRLISSLGNAIYFPYLAVVVILGAIWLAWQGLIRKRGTRTIEGTIWMVVACAAAIWLIGRPADFTGIGKTVSDGITQTLNVAFAKLPSPGQGSCVPVQRSDPQAQASFTFTSGNNIVDQNADELWTVLVCKPWLDGEFGTTAFAVTPGGRQTLVNTYARQLLWAQAIAVNEKPTTALIQAKQATYRRDRQNIQRKIRDLPALPGQAMDDAAGDRVRRAVRRGRRRGARTADRRHADPAQAGFPAAARGGAVLPADRHASRLRPGGRVALVRDAGRRPAQTGGGRARAERAALLLRPDHGHSATRCCRGR